MTGSKEGVRGKMSVERQKAERQMGRIDPGNEFDVEDQGVKATVWS